jgi:multisubunit Na+/H+ antiporter MnhG subunit
VGNPSAAFIVKAVLCGVFITLTFPTGAHALARGSHLGGVKLWEKSVGDAYDEVAEEIRQRDEAGVEDAPV